MNDTGYLGQVQQRLVEQGFTGLAAPADLPLAVTLLREESWGRLLLALPAAQALQGEEERAALARGCAAWVRNLTREAPCYLILVFPFPGGVDDRLSASIRALQQQDAGGRWGLVPWTVDLDVELIDRPPGFPRVDDRLVRALTEVERGAVAQVYRQATAPRIGRRPSVPGGLGELGEVPATRVILASTIAFYLWTVLMAGSLELLIAGADSRTLVLWGANYGPLVAEGQAWRLLSHVMLHGGLLHLGFNMYALWHLGRHVELVYGTGRMLFIYAVAGVAGGYASALVRPSPVLSVGASGAILGLMGALVYFGYSLRGRNVDWRSLLGPVATTLLYGFLIGGIDNWAHIGGLLGGALSGFIAGVPGQRSSWRTAAMAVVGLGVLAVVTGVVPLRAWFW